MEIFLKKTEILNKKNKKSDRKNITDQQKFSG